jgi:Amt family ammonium transporter
MDVFAEHGIAGMVGLMFNALFGVDYVVGLDGVNTGVSNPTTGTGIGGWPIGNYRQFYIQLAYIVACTGYSFVMSALLAYIVNFIPGLHLRASEEAELLGMDDDQLGEFAYDYVEVRRDYLAWTPNRTDQQGVDPDMPQEDRHGIGEHSMMIKNSDAASSGSGSAGGPQGMPAQGDRHAVAAEDQAKARREQNHQVGHAGDVEKQI